MNGKQKIQPLVQQSQQQVPQRPQPVRKPSGLGTLIKWLIVLALIAGGIYLLYKLGIIQKVLDGFYLLQKY